MAPRAPAPTLHALVAGLVDYAGLFPPAARGMADAAAAYAAYRDSRETWMLGRFVVPAVRLDELAEAALRFTGGHSGPWPLAALVGDDVEGDMDRVRRSNELHAGRLQVDVVEVRTTTPDAIRSAAAVAGPSLMLFAELPVAADPRELLLAVRAARVRAKVRTGGVTPEAIPTPAELARFVVRCAELGVPFKATAGLHHPIRAEHRLSYEVGAPRGTMFGFLNVFVAAAFALAGATEAVVTRLLEERDAGTLHFGAEALRWGDHALTLEQLHDARASFAISFGSCSFREPVDDLHRLALL